MTSVHVRCAKAPTRWPRNSHSRRARRALPRRFRQTTEQQTGSSVKEIQGTAFNETNPLVIHIENARSLMPVFIVRPDQYDKALARYPDVARRVRTTWGFDLETYARD